MSGDITDEEQQLVAGMPKHVAAGYIRAKRAAEQKRAKRAPGEWDWDAVAEAIAAMGDLAR
jgi:hypothetical protein